MATASTVVVDTNLLFSALLSSQSKFTEILLTSEHQFYVCELVLVELFKHKEKTVGSAACPKMTWYGCTIFCCAGLPCTKKI